tara:strand:- start:923 stop:1165 length:243 start_codon:yes stop_codon:yes gene_type:complete
MSNKKKEILKGLLLTAAFSKIDTVMGKCSGCEERSILVAVATEFYRCSNCGEDMRQYVNGSIKYLELTEKDKEYLKLNRL